MQPGGRRGFYEQDISMKKVIATTTINPPTEALLKFAAMKDWTLVVAGDNKTPHDDYSKINCVYLSPKHQQEYDPALSEAIGMNCIQRRNFAYLFAVKELGADIVASIDDDNIPLPGWGEDLMLGREIGCTQYSTTQDAFDPLFVTNHPHIWHRGFPLQLVNGRNAQGIEVVKKFNVQADTWNQEPDIDATCRMIYAPNCNFDDNRFPFCADKISPFNSQNTFVMHEVMQNYFLFPHTGRMDDIWASFHAQRHGASVIYGCASVIQKRNDHDLTKDMKAEYLGYENNLKIIQALQTNPDAVLDFLPDRSRYAFSLYQKHFQ
jgi:hypothetical protein